MIRLILSALVLAQASAPVDPSAPRPAGARPAVRAVQFQGPARTRPEVDVSGYFHTITVSTLPASKPLDLDLNNIAVRDAAKQVLERAGIDADLTVDADVPSDTRITLRAGNVKASTALDLIAQAAGAGWSVEKKSGRTAVRFGKSVRSGLVQLRKDLGGLEIFEGIGAREFVVPVAPMTSVAVERYVVSGQRSTFNCPHCKGQVTILRQKKPAQCSKCGRTFDGDWQYCPFDGTKRPASAPEWRYCPLCGRRVDVEKSEGVSPSPEEPDTHVFRRADPESDEAPRSSTGRRQAPSDRESRHRQENQRTCRRQVRYSCGNGES